MATVDYPSSFYSKISIPEYRGLQTSVTPVPVSTSTEPINRLTKQVTSQLFNHIIAPGDTFFLFDDKEVGELTSFEIAVDNPDVIFQVITYADNPEVPRFINDFQMHELLSMGRGLTPGDVTPMPNGQTQDIPGRPSNSYPFLARFKFDDDPDFTSQFTTNIIFGSLPNIIVFKFEPTNSVSYKEIVANIINTDSVNPATVISLDIQRLIHDQLLPGESPPLEATTKIQPVVKRTVEISSPNYDPSPSSSLQTSSDEIQYES